MDTTTFSESSLFSIEKLSNIPGVFKIGLSVYKDFRGNLFTTILNDNLSKIEKQIPEKFNHDKIALSKNRVIRGIHGDRKSYKLVTCLYGKIQQVIVDNRPESETYLEHISLVLDYNEPTLILIPPGCGNGFLTLSDESLYQYKLNYQGDYNDAENQFTLSWNDPRINIKWLNDNPILSERDNGNYKK